jgi:hypothetical protein
VGGADYALAAQFNGGATLQAKTSTLLPKLNEPVSITAELTAEGVPITLDSAQVQLRRPDGSAETMGMVINENIAVLTVKPAESGIHGMEASITAHTLDGMEIDRAAFLTFEVQPSSQVISMYQLTALLGLIFVVGLIGWLIKRRR